MSEIINTKTLICEVENFVNSSPWQSKYSARLQRMYDLVEMPCELAIAGKVKAGKSSFLNALLGIDLAVVGTSETTATINYFKYGTPVDPNKPVIVYWNDGRKPEAKDSSFLDKLQGYSKDVLDIAERIDHLEYLLPHEDLKQITLIDTPGVGSLEDVHEQKTSDYFNPRSSKLRDKHAEQSTVLTESADAVVYISERVPRADAKKFFGDNIPNLSSFNAIGIMTKIDIENDATFETIESMAKTLADCYKKELYTVVPVSAGVYHSLKKLEASNKLVELQNNIRKIPQDKFELRFKGSDTFLQEDGAYNSFFEKCGLPITVRKAMMSQMDWGVFYIISKCLYYKNIEEAKKYLIEYSGMEKVKSTLKEQFFKRSHIIRCAKIIRELQIMLADIRLKDLPALYSESKSLDDYIDIIDKSTSSMINHKEALKALIRKQVCSTEDCNDFKGSLESIQSKVECLQQSLMSVDNSSEAQMLLTKCSHLLRTEEERNELKDLFNQNSANRKSGDLTYWRERQRKWNGRLHVVQNNPEYRRLVQLVIDSYGQLITRK